MRIAFVIPSLGAGGAERVASLLANDWSAIGHEVTLVTFDAPGTEAFFALHPGIALRGLSAPGRASRASWQARAPIWPASRGCDRCCASFDPDVVVAFMTEANVIALWASQGLGVPVVISERNQPDRPGLGTAHRLARRFAYPKASAIVVQTDAHRFMGEGALQHSCPRHSQPGSPRRRRSRAVSSAMSNG